ncbi:MAG: hypothetical protein AB1595_06755 [bacterium]
MTTKTILTRRGVLSRVDNMERELEFLKRDFIRVFKPQTKKTKPSLYGSIKGITATPLQIDYQGKPSFLVDASVFPGSSGNPVFICNSGIYSDKRGNTVVGSSRVFFLGIIAEVIIREDRGKIEFVSISTIQLPIVKTQQMIDLGIVYKSSAVLETVLDFLKKFNQK